jgi:hypothetical protein
LIVDLPAAFAKDATYTFKDNLSKEKFPVENRNDIGQSQVDFLNIKKNTLWLNNKFEI